MLPTRNTIISESVVDIASDHVGRMVDLLGCSDATLGPHDCAATPDRERGDGLEPRRDGPSSAQLSADQRAVYNGVALRYGLTNWSDLDNLGAARLHQSLQ